MEECVIIFLVGSLPRGTFSLLVPYSYYYLVQAFIPALTSQSVLFVPSPYFSAMQHDCVSMALEACLNLKCLKFGVGGHFVIRGDVYPHDARHRSLVPLDTLIR